MAKEEFGSVENLATSGRANSRGNLFASTGFDDILDKLKMLHYQKEFCLPNNINPINRFYFQVADTNSNHQLFVFASLIAWIFSSKLNVSFPAPGQFDDPNETCSRIVSELKKIGIPLEFGPVKLKPGYGEGCIYVLQNLVDLVFANLKLSLSAPIHKIDDYPDEAEVDHDAEITSEKVEEIEANQEEDERYSSIQKKQDKKEQISTAPKLDPAEWRLEVERVAPLLRLKLSNDNKDWRMHIQQMDHHYQKIAGGMVGTQAKLEKLHSEIGHILEKICSREKYINSQFEGQIDYFKRLQEQSSDSKKKYALASSNVSGLTNELSQVSEDLESVKARMDDLGSGMTDSKPLTAIKQASTRLNGELKQMDLRIGVIENTLLHAKLKGKSNLSLLELTSNKPFGTENFFLTANS